MAQTALPANSLIQRNGISTSSHKPMTKETKRILLTGALCGLGLIGFILFDYLLWT
jgi:hypothetical protein